MSRSPACPAPRSTCQVHLRSEVPSRALSEPGGQPCHRSQSELCHRSCRARSFGGRQRQCPQTACSPCLPGPAILGGGVGVLADLPPQNLRRQLPGTACLNPQPLSIPALLSGSPLTSEDSMQGVLHRPGRPFLRPPSSCLFTATVYKFLPCVNSLPHPSMSLSEGLTSRPKRIDREGCGFCLASLPPAGAQLPSLLTEGCTVVVEGS